MKFCNNNYIAKVILSLCLLFASVSLLKADEGKSEEKGAFDLKEMLFSHVLDSYDWHLFTVGGHHYSIPLPVIVRSPERGWFVFSSSRLAHGENYEGFQIAHDGTYKGKIVELSAVGEQNRPLDLSLTKNAASICFASLLLIVLLVSLASGYKKDPFTPRRGFAGSVEMLTLSILNDVIKPCVGSEYRRFAPYLLTAFFFIFFNNLLGLIPIVPGGANVTGNISITFVLALFTFVITNFFGSKEYWKEIFWPDVPLWLKAPLPIMPFIELLGIFTKPFALMIRLFANMLAGHIVILVLVGLIFIFSIMIGPVVAAGVSVVSVAFSIFMLLLDVLISFIQAYVFTMLSSIFIGMGRIQHHASH
ncbi:MAG: F0F1 ATP synthase subunit A [Dysgonamonadaceae bacterium]|jgi:F-type H+-transporting ATPase subunit a|nr:F0F1 ATP synthase subunit A [Dysgonamonadaceae bacterium]